MEKKRSIDAIEFMRGICAIGIIIYHFLGRSRSPVEFLHNFKNGTMGSTYVTIFFVISGMVLYYNYPKVDNLKLFYYKRFRSIYPMFWIAYAYFFIGGVFATGDLFYQGKPWLLIFSFLGIDGYLETKLATYFYVGEWFLGAIILLYLLYPLFSAGFRRSTWISSLLMVSLYIWMMKTQYFTMYAIRNIIACALSFCFGIVISKHSDFLLKSRWILGISAAIFLFLSFVRVIPAVNEYFVTQIYGYSLFFLLYHFGALVMKNQFFSGLFRPLGKLSYAIFLLQHQVVDRMADYQNPVGIPGTILMIVLTILLTIVCAKVLSVVTSAVLQSNFYRKIEKKILT